MSCNLDFSSNKLNKYFGHGRFQQVYQNLHSVLKSKILLKKSFQIELGELNFGIELGALEYFHCFDHGLGELCIIEQLGEFVKLSFEIFELGEQFA